MRLFTLSAGLVSAAALVAVSSVALAQEAPAPAPMPAVSKVLAGGTMTSDKTVAQNVAAARDLADFTAAMKSADLEGMLGAPGPLTVFAATRGGFDRLPKGDLDRWMRSDKRKLASVITYSIVPEALTDDVLSERIKAGKGEAYLATVQGGNLTVRGGGHNFTVTDVNGDRARVVGGAPQANGMLYVVDNVLQP